MKEKITFADLVDKIAEETGSSKQLVQDLLHETVNLTREGLSKDGHVNIIGLGRFYLKWHNARSGSNPQTGEVIEIPGHSIVNYKPSVDLRKYINRKYAHLQAEILDEDKPVIGTHITAPVIEEKIVAALVTESPKAPLEKEKKRPTWWLWILITLLIIILAYMAWNFWVKSETDKEPITTEKVNEDVIVQPIEADEPVKESQPAETGHTVAVTMKEEPIKVLTPTGTSGGEQTVKPGDNLWAISQRYYNKGDLWPNIYRVNLIEIENPDNLAFGVIIQIPPFEGKVGSLTHNDSTNIAEGNIHAYLVYKKLNKTNAKDYLWVASRYDVDNKLSQFSDEIDEGDLKIIKGIKPKK